VNTYFIRHTERLDIDQATRDSLWKQKKIAIHYPNDKFGKLRDRDNRSFSLDDYSGPARTYMRILTELANDGGYVCAEYYRHPQCVLGYVKPGSKIELFKGKWGDDLQGRTALLKSLPLKKVKLVKPSAYAVIAAARPRQGTVMRWRKAGKVIETIVEGKRYRTSFDLLSPDQQEIMCSEFLRLREAEKLGLSRLAHLVLPVGRTLKTVDICGTSTAGGRIFGQVTHNALANCDQKLERLREYRGGGNELVLFCDCDGSKPQRKDGVLIVSIRDVYARFTATASGKKWLRTASKIE
jgi:hypothetical protein